MMSGSVSNEENIATYSEVLIVYATYKLSELLYLILIVDKGMTSSRCS